MSAGQELADRLQTAPEGSEGRRRLSHFVQFHENPRIISAWMGLTGPLLKLLTPPRRRSLLAVGAVGVALKYLVPSMKELMKSAGGTEALPAFICQLLVVSALFGFLWLCYWLALNFSSLPSFVRRNPQTCLHAIFWVSLAAIWISSPEAGIWRMVLVGVAIMIPLFLWRVGYLLLSAQRNKVAGTRFRDHLMYFWPVYGGSNTPYGKGLDYLSRNEAKDERALAVSQLAGVRLLILAGIWHVTREIMKGVVFGADNSVRLALGGFTLGLVRLGPLVEQHEAVSIGLGWATIYCELVLLVLNHAVKGHVVIGILRLFGFYVFRNTYKPLLSESVVEFWNRYYYYFKEVMVDFFFYPTFARWFRKRRVLRLFAAVFMAAFVGNMYYHLIRSSEELVRGDFNALWMSLHARLFYCLLLSLGIFVSMLREQRKPGHARTHGIARRGLSIFGVWTFFALINIWNQKGHATFVPLTRFFFGLMGLG